MTIIEKIRAEVERLKKREVELMDNSQKKYGNYPPSCDIMLVAYQNLLSILSDLEKSEKPTNPVERIGSYNIVPYIDDKIAALQDMWRKEKVSFDWDDLKDMIEDVARHFYDLGRQSKPRIVFSKEVFDQYDREQFINAYKPKVCEELEEEIDRIVKCEKEFMNFKFKSQLIGYIARHFAQWGAEHTKKNKLVMEDYDKIKKVLALGFMHCLDENRPEGKMCLSNGECADIEKAFNEQDWSKLARYLDKYLVNGGSSGKPVPAVLEEAAKKCNSNLQLQEYFIKGGIWQKKQFMEGLRSYCLDQMELFPGEQDVARATRAVYYDIIGYLDNYERR